MYSATNRAKIGKYACQNGTALAAWHFTGKIKKIVSKSKVKLIKKGYIKELVKWRRADDREELTAFPAKKRGRKLARQWSGPQGSGVPQETKRGRGGCVSTDSSGNS